MKKFMMVALAVLAGCGLSEDKFQDKFSEKMCAYLQGCPEGGDDVDCEVEEDTAAAGEEIDLSECFDKKIAKECLADMDALAECDGDVLTALGDIPASCGKVYDADCVAEKMDVDTAAE